jgi:hypothetical protein
MIFSKIAGNISEIAGDLAISEQNIKKIIIPASFHEIAAVSFFTMALSVHVLLL